VKKLLILLLATSAFASIPVRDENGCIIGTRGAEEGAGPDIAAELKALNIKEDRVALVPFYLIIGRTDKQTFVTHPFGNNEINCPPITHYKTELLLPITRKLVGHLEKAFSDVYITVPTPNEIMYFPYNDVYVESTQEWSFKEFRGKL